MKNDSGNSGEHILSPENESLSPYLDSLPPVLDKLSPEVKEELSTRSNETRDSGDKSDIVYSILFPVGCTVSTISN